MTPQVWADSVYTGYQSYKGPYPKVAVFHGSSDATINIVNETEIMKQWTQVHGISQTPSQVVNSFNGNSLVTEDIFYDTTGIPVVETYTISGMGHGIALDTGTCYQKGGETGSYALQEQLFSSFWAAYFFNILGNDAITISGLQNVPANKNSVSYSVPNISGVTYNWTVPSGATIASGQGTNTITVDFTTYSGNVSVTETSTGSCELGPANLFVTVSNTTGINEAISNNDEINIYPNPSKGSFVIKTNYLKNQTLQMFDVTGKLVLTQLINGAATINADYLAGGIYNIRIVNDDGVTNKRIAIIK
ncbi:MAG: T9SS type A sorting domain-containing protein [Bacteroidia bacterium]